MRDVRTLCGSDSHRNISLSLYIYKWINELINESMYSLMLKRTVLSSVSLEVQTVEEEHIDSLEDVVLM